MTRRAIGWDATGFFAVHLKLSDEIWQLNREINLESEVSSFPREI